MVLMRGGIMKNLVVVAGNGLLDRRAFLRGGAALAAAMTGYTLARPASAAPLADDPWSRAPGTNVPAYGVPSRFEKNVARTLSNPNGEPRTQHARTPHHLLQGTSTRTALTSWSPNAATPDTIPRNTPLGSHGLANGRRRLPSDAPRGFPLLRGWPFVNS